MNPSFYDLLYLFSCGAKDVVPKITRPVNVPEVIQLAHRQSVSPIVFSALKNAHTAGEISLEPEVLQSVSQSMYMMVVAHTQRQKAVYELIGELERAGIACCILKGEVLAQNYASPALRISSDTDILIDPAHEQAVSRFLKSKGFKCRNRGINSHHLEYHDERTGLLEFHVSLYDEIYEDIWFENQAMREEAYRTVETEDGYLYKTLGFTNGAIFIAMHLIKHFLTCGVGVKQLMDMLRYNACYIHEIDWAYFDDFLKRLNFDYFYDVCVSIGEVYLQFDAGELHRISGAVTDMRLLEAVLDDMEKGGVYGKDDIFRNSFSRVYTRLKLSDSVKKESLRKWWRNATLVNIFPSAEVLGKKYPYVSKSRLLYPFAWLHRSFHFVFSLANRTKHIKTYTIEGNDQSDSVQKRIALVKQLGMLR